MRRVDRLFLSRKWMRALRLSGRWRCSTHWSTTRWDIGVLKQKLHQWKRALNFCHTYPLCRRVLKCFCLYCVVVLETRPLNRCISDQPQSSWEQGGRAEPLSVGTTPLSLWVVLLLSPPTGKSMHRFFFCGGCHIKYAWWNFLQILLLAALI